MSQHTHATPARRAARAGAVVPAWLAFSYVVSVKLILETGSDPYGAGGATVLTVDLLALVAALGLTALVGFRGGFLSSVFAMLWFALELALKAQLLADGRLTLGPGPALLCAAILGAGAIGLRGAWRLRELQGRDAGAALDLRVFD